MALIFDEQFEAAGYDETSAGAGGNWAEAGDGTVDEDYATSSVTGAPASWGDQCLKLISGTWAQISNTLDTAVSGPFYIRCDFIFSGFTGLSSTPKVIFQLWNVGLEATVMRLQIYNDGANKAQFYFWDAGEYFECGTIVANTRYRMDIYFNATTDEYEVKWDGVSKGTGEDTYNSFASISVVGVYAPIGLTGITMYADNVQIATDGWVPGDSTDATPTPDEQTLTWTQNAPAPTAVNLPAKQDLTWTQNEPALYTVQAEPDAVELTWTLNTPDPQIIALAEKQDLTWTQNAPADFQIIALGEKQDLTWAVNAIAATLVPVDAQELTWSVNAPTLDIHSDFFVHTEDDQWVRTADDLWHPVIVAKQNLTWTENDPALYTVQAEPAKVSLEWTQNAPDPQVYVDAEKQDLTYTLESTTQIVTGVPSKVDITWTLNAPTPIGINLPDKQDLTWAANAVTATGTTGKTVTPSARTLTWSLKTISISSADYFTDTDADKWQDTGPDEWAFHTGGSTTKKVYVDKLELAWSQGTPAANYDKVVYPYDYLKNENGFPVRDEAGNPIEIGKPVLEATWAVNDDVTIGKLPSNRVEPNGLNLAWTLNSSVIVQLGPAPDALTLGYTLNEGVPTVYVFPEKSDLTWSQPEPTILDDVTITPDAFEPTWTLNTPRLYGVLGRSQRRGLLLGVYGR